MKKIFITIITYFLILGSIALTGCESKSVNTFPPPEGYSSWDEYYQKHNQESPTPQTTETLPSTQPSTTVSPTPTTTPVSTPTTTMNPTPISTPIIQALTYEVINSYIEEGTFNERHQIIIGDEVIQDEIVTVRFPIGCVVVQNTDNVSGTFDIHFLFYKYEKHTPKNLINEMRTTYESNQIVSLQAGEIGTARYEVPDIEIDTDTGGIFEWVWGWDFQITPSTKTILQ
jgi:hypothetical protein